MMDGFKDFLETSTYLIVIGETMIKPREIAGNVAHVKDDKQS